MPAASGGRWDPRRRNDLWWPGSRCPGGQIERGVATEDSQLELLEAGTGLEPQLLGQATSELLVDLERLGLPPRSVEREHELAAQPLTQRVARDQIAQLPHQLAGVAEGQIGLHALLHRGQT